MKLIVLVVGLLLSQVTHATDINEVRNLYRYAKDSQENTEKFYELVQKTDYANNNVLTAYYGCALTLKASLAKKRGDKIALFKQGKKLIEEAISNNPDNIELRMIRLSVQMNVPKITRYYKNIDEDKRYIIQNIDKVTSVELKEFIKGFMSQSKAFKK